MCLSERVLEMADKQAQEPPRSTTDLSKSQGTSPVTEQDQALPPPTPPTSGQEQVSQGNTPNENWLQAIIVGLAMLLGVIAIIALLAHFPWWLAVMLVFGAVILLAYRFQWQWTGIPGKTGWDWAQIVIIPLVLLVLGSTLSTTQQAISDKALKQQHDTDMQIAQDQLRENELSSYLTSMAGLLQQPNVRADTQTGADIRSLARAQTLTILKELPADPQQDPEQRDPARKARVMGFLHDSGLMTRDPFPLVNLANADFSYVALHRAHLGGADLAGVDLSHADLSGANLSAADLSSTILTGANLSGAQLVYAPLTDADLSHTNLAGADLSGADLSGAILSNATLAGADITGTTPPTDGGFSPAQLSAAKHPAHWKLIQTDTTVVIAYNQGTSLPAYGRLDLNTSMLYLVYGPLSHWGTALVLLPALWSQEDCVTDYCEMAPVTITKPLAEIDASRSDIVLPLRGTIAGLQVDLTVDFSSPTQGALSVSVLANAGDADTLPLDSDHQIDAFKAVLLRSAFYSAKQWVAQQAFTSDESFPFLAPPTFTRLIGTAASTFGLTGGTSDLARNTPTITVSMDNPASVLVTAEELPSSDSTTNNISLWGSMTAQDLLASRDSWSYTVTASNPANAVPFNLVVTSPYNGQVLQQGIPITCTGTYTGPSPASVWVVLKDTFGQYYLQNPPVEFYSDGTWIASSIIPGPNISEIDVVQVTSDGNANFQQKVANSDFGGFPQLPAGSTVLAMVSIQVQ